MKLMIPARLQRRIHPLGGGLFLALLLCSGVLFAMDDCWTSVSGPLDFKLVPDHGDLGSESASVHPGIREKAVTWTGPDGSLYLFGGMSLDMAAFSEVAHNDLWRFNPATDAWSWIGGSDLPNQPGDYDPAEGVGPTPGARSYAMSWTGSGGKLYLFGGYGYSAAGDLGFLNDLWRYDLDTGVWTWLKGSEAIEQVGSYSALGVADEANTPGARRGSVAWTGADGQLYLFGGHGLGAAEGRKYLNDLWTFDTSTLQWTWLKGGAEGDETGVYGTLGSPDDVNLPGGRAYASAWTAAAGTLYLFGGARYVTGGDSGNFNDLWAYEPSTNQWTWLAGDSALNQPGSYGAKGVADEANAPPNRSYATAWTGSGGALYLFGGVFCDAVIDSVTGVVRKKYFQKNDLWRYDPASGQWTWVHGGDGLNETGLYGEQGVGDAANTPGSRSYASVWTDGEGKAFLYGGHGYDVWSSSDLLNDFWRYDPAINQWAWFNGGNPQTQNGVYDDLGEAHPAARPSARHNAGGWTAPADQLYIFGGAGLDPQGQRGRLNDLWRYDPATVQWTWLAGSAIINQPGVYGTRGLADAANTPGAREGVAVWSASDGTGYLFGGVGVDSQSTQGYLNDLWRYEPGENQWTWRAGSDEANPPGVYGTRLESDTANTPGSRRDAATWQGLDGMLYLFGGDGYGETGGFGSLGDLWRYDTATGQWTWLAGEKLIDQSGTYGTLGVADDANVPGGRFAAMAWTGGDGALYLYGGDGYDSQGNAGVLSDLWRYDPAAGLWTWLAGGDLRRQVGVWGVRGVASGENTPGCRAHGTAWVDASGLFYLFGGKSRSATDLYDQEYNDLWRYNVATNQWTWLNGSAEPLQPGVYGQPGGSLPANTPGARAGAMAWTQASGTLSIFGGIGYDAGGNYNELNDLWSYEPGRLAASGWSLYR